MILKKNFKLIKKNNSNQIKDNDFDYCNLLNNKIFEYKVNI